MKVATEEKKKIILRHLLGKTHYDKVIMYDDAVPNLDAFLSLAQDYPWSKFYAWHVDREGGATEYHRSGAGIKENFADGKVKEMAPPPISVKSATLYHGTPTLNNARGIIRNGLKFDPESIAQKYQGSENFAPLPGVYLSKDFGNAVRYSFMSEVPDDQYAEHIKQEPYGYVFEFSGQDLSQTSPDEDELGRLLEKFVKAKNPPPKLSALIQSIPENLKSQLSHPDVSFETIAVAGKWLVSKLAPQTLQYLMQRYINVVNYGIMKPVAVWKIPKPEQRFLRDRQGTFDTHNGYINWANRYGKKQSLEENFADGKKPGRKGLSRRVGIPKKATLGQLEKIAKSSTGERRRMAQWQLNMRRGKAKKNK